VLYSFRSFKLNGVLALTRIASSKAILLCALFLIASLKSTTQTTQPPPSSRSSRPLEIQRHVEQAIVTGTYSSVPLHEADRTIRLITIDESPEMFRNAMDALQSAPSIDLRQRAPGIQGDLSIRGSSFGQTLVLVDGLRLNDAQTAHNNLDLPFPFASTQQIEVLEGSGSTLYGADAVGGVVNFITGAPQFSEIRLGAAGGSFGTNAQNGSLAYVTDRLAEQLTFNRELSTGFLPDRDYRNLALGSTATLRSHLGLTDLLLGLSDRPFGANGFYGSYPSWERTKGWLAVLHRHNTLKPNVRIYYGADGYRDTIDSNNLGHHTRDRGAAYAAFDVRALRRFSFNLGVREEYLTGGHSAFTPSASGGYWLNNRLKLHASVSTAFRLPTFTDLYYSDPSTLGNPHLLPEKALSYAGGAQVTFARVAADVTVFDRHDRNDIDYIRPNAAAPWQAANIQNLHFTGATFSARIQLASSQTLDVAYTALHGIQGVLSGEQSEYVFEYPVQSATVIWWGRLPGHVDTRLRVGVLERYARNPYPLLQFSAAREFPHVKPYVQLSNLTNTGYEEIPGVRMPGRSYLVGLEFFARASHKQ
jgi:outer membrane cobalamin receptor